MTLFDPGEPLPPVERESYDVRLTRRRTAMLASGVHPTTRMPLLKPEGHTCGDCVHHYADGGHAKTFHKCEKVAHTFGPSSDVRVRWPACELWEAE